MECNEFNTTRLEPRCYMFSVQPIYVASALPIHGFLSHGLSHCNTLGTLKSDVTKRAKRHTLDILFWIVRQLAVEQVHGFKSEHTGFLGRRPS